MTAPKPRASDGRLVGARAENGSEDRGLTEATQIVRGPSKLIDGMRALAEKTGVPIAEHWRRAAEFYLRDQGKR